MESIQRRLGYRFVLREGKFPSAIKQNDSLKISLTIDNIGYASPFNARPVQLVLRNTANSSTHTLTFDTMIQRWFPGTIKLDQSFNVKDIAEGDYELLLNFPDQHDSIKDRVEYSIRLANENMWEVTTGYNKLNHTISIQ
jgi:hypothetical protein